MRIRNNCLGGRVVKLHKLGKALTFFHIIRNGDIVECVYENDLPKLNCGDFVLIEGMWKSHPRKDKCEFHVRKFEQILVSKIKVNESHLLTKFFDPISIEAQKIRINVEQSIMNFYLKKEFKLVRSPKIVGNWVKGQTGYFELDFYGKESNLTISTMLHHQIILTFGYEKIFEVATLFRKEYPSSSKRLAEFTNIVVGLSLSSLSEVIYLFTEMLNFIYENLNKIELKYILLPKNIQFEHITYCELLSRANVLDFEGHQFPEGIRNYLNRHFESFVWVTNFPEEKRPFYVKSVNNQCEDCQLWYKGTNFIAAGGETEQDVDILIKKIIKEGKNPKDYQFLIDTYNFGNPNIVGIDLGIERFLSAFLSLDSADFSFFPRFKNCLMP